MLPRIPKRFVALVFGVLALHVMSSAGKSAPQPKQPTQQQIQQMQQQQQQMQQQMQQQLQQARQQAQQQQQQMQQYIAQLQRNQAMRNQQAAQQAARQQQGQRPGQGQPQLRDVTTTYEFIVADEGVVRTMVLLAPELDEKGRPKKLDAEEKKKLKGDSEAERKFTGWKAGMEDIQAGDEIIVTLARHRPTKGAAKKKGDDGDEDAPKMKGKAKEGDDEEKPKEKKAKAKDADDEEKPKAKAKEKEKEDGEEKPKAKGKEKDKEGDEEAKEVKKIDQSMWRPVGKLMGTVSEADSSGSRRIVIRITQKQMVMPGGGGRGGQGGAGAPNDNNISIDPANMQATLVVITKRGTGMESPGGDTGFGGFGK